MVGSDIMTFEPGNGNLIDRYITGKNLNGVTSTVEQQDWTNVAVSSGATVAVAFTRAYTTGDVYDWPFSFGTMNLVWARGSTPTLGYHSSTCPSFQVKSPIFLSGGKKKGGGGF